MEAIIYFFIFLSVCGLIWIAFAAHMIRSWLPIQLNILLIPVISLLVGITSAMIARSDSGTDSLGIGNLVVFAAFLYFGVLGIPLALGISMLPKAVWPLDIRRASADQIFVRKATRYVGCIFIAVALPTILFFMSKL